MISTTTLLSNVPPTPAPSTKTASSVSEPNSEPASPNEPSRRKIKTSPQLNRWSRARAIRSGKKLQRPVHKTGSELNSNSNSNSVFRSYYSESDSEDERGIISVNEIGRNKGMDQTEVTGTGKSIYMVSDGTGWTAEHSVNAALGQFEHCLVDRVCPVNTHLFSGVCLQFYCFN